MSSLHENVQVADFQRCEPTFAWPSCNLVQVSGMHCHASSTRGRTFVYFVLYCIEYSGSLSLLQAQMSRSKHKSSSSVAELLSVRWWWKREWSEVKIGSGRQFTHSQLTLCDSKDCSKSGFSVHHQLPELAQTHVHWVGGAIQISHPLSSPSPPAFNLSQYQDLFQWVTSWN